ncbi:GNAT family N-acetyltransferase [Methylophilus sp. VKM B-3414]|uniref:GNAT family N-acetyltransferase n=1 Tax=Methylophilus sp. VKM B-3414 TaxID=3076121 RepID=UPI0028C84770|nr:GNAT family N-acetyltransferase [Methylophilus sp. VKM B-3414]MDT7848869.1 GNAT family N-acetyltransferase [Methylophilus sp. VKM B-3414]
MSVKRIELRISTLSKQDPLWADCSRIRQQVFIHEQQVPEALEWDAADDTAVHLLAHHAHDAVACARVLPGGYIGRMAVLPAWRRRGIGEAMLLQAIQICRQWELSDVRLSAQRHAIGFYEQAGFVVCSEPYLDANILHVDMQLELI